MSYGDYQAIRADGQVAHDKEEEQRRLLLGADAVFGVGPLLRDAGQRLCQARHQVWMLVPGLAEIESASIRPGSEFRAITFGRLGGEDDRIKQGRLAAHGYGDFVRRARTK